MIKIRHKRELPDTWILWCRRLNLDPEGTFEVVNSFEQLVNNLEEPPWNMPPPRAIHKKFFIFRELPTRDPLTNEVKKRQHYTHIADAFEVLGRNLVKDKFLGDYS